MKKDEEKPGEEMKVDLKHDNMEFAVPAEGADTSDFDDENYEEEEISAEELDLLDAEEDEEAAAYVSVENELPLDEDNLPEEDWTDDLPDADAEEDSDPGDNT